MKHSTTIRPVCSSGTVQRRPFLNFSNSLVPLGSGGLRPSCGGGHDHLQHHPHSLFCLSLNNRGAPIATKRATTISPSASSSSSSDPAPSRPPLPQSPADLTPGTILDNRYRVVSVLGRGGNGVTYRCVDTSTSTEQLVAIKALTLRGLRDWKQLELFEREAKILENLDHPGIPRYIDYFEEDTDADRSFYLVQRIADGASLEAMVSRGWRATEEEITRIARELLNILRYLGSLRPAVIHRDVKPSNIIIEGGTTGGRVFLVDFGAVQGISSTGDGIPGSTIVGTFGFMAPEQFRGSAQPASDLYGLGGTLLFLLSGRPPSAFPVDRMRVDLSTVAMGPRLSMVVEGLLEPVLEDRLTAEEALSVLDGKKAKVRGGGTVGGSLFQKQQAPKQKQQQLSSTAFGVKVPGPLRKPPGSRVQVTKRGPRLEIYIPPAGFDGNVAATGAFAIAWNAFVAFWTASALAGGGILFALFSLPFWYAGVSLVKQAFGRQLIRERLEIGLGTWKLSQQLAVLKQGGGGGDGDGNKVDWGKGNGKQVGGKTADLVGADAAITAYINGAPQGQLVLRQGVESFVLGEGLDPLEQDWLANVINSHLREVGETRGEIENFYEDGDVEVGGDGVSDRMLYDEFARFDKKLGRDVGEEAARRARVEGERAAAAAKRAGEEARRAARRSVARSGIDPSIIDLSSADFEDLD